MKEKIKIFLAVAALFFIALPAKALVTNADVAANAGIVYSKLDLKGKISSSDIKNGTIKSKDIDKSAVESSNIKNETIKNEDVSDSAAIDGTKINPDFGSQNVTGTGTLGTSGSRWSTIYAGTLNYSTAISDANAGASTVTIGDSKSADALTVTANTTLTSDHWSVTEPGVATFTGINGPIGGVTPSTASFTTITLANSETISNAVDGEFLFHRNDSGIVTLTATDNDANAALTVTPGGTGALVLGSGTTPSITVTSSATGTAAVVLPAGSIDSTEILDGTITTSDIAADTITAGNIAAGAVGTSEILDATVTSTDIADGTIAGSDLASNIAITTTGAVDFSGASSVKLPAVTLGAACTVSGTVGVNPAGNAGERIMVCNGSNWLAN